MYGLAVNEPQTASVAQEERIATMFAPRDQYERGRVVSSSSGALSSQKRNSCQGSGLSVCSERTSRANRWKTGADAAPKSVCKPASQVKNEGRVADGFS